MRVALVTAADHPDLVEDDQPLRASLEHRGAAVTPAVWTDESIDWAGFDLAVIRSTWDYPARLEEFHAWLDRASALVRLENSPATVRWNSHKGYLDELQARGMPVVPTHTLPRGSAHDLAAVLRKRGWGQAVVKPAVAVGSQGAARVALREATEHQDHLDGLLARGDVLVQPFVESIPGGGERSLIFIDGRYSHAVRKRPAEGDFRVQPQFGGVITADQPPQKLRDLGRTILEAAEVEPLYARVDLVQIGSRWKLMELELIEPLLYFHTDAKAVHRFADAVLARV